jgi:3-isopropylmalate/(R)-2-methylmalate dehydratase small subunit
MAPFDKLTAVAAPIDLPNVDTDQIAPARFLRRPREEGYADILFHDVRKTPEGAMKPDFVLNKPAYQTAGILVADRNFGGGSSREQAVWALVDSGIRCVIAVSFGDIFYNNSVKHGLLLIRQPAEVSKRVREELHDAPGSAMTVDLEAQTFTMPKGGAVTFDIEPSRKRRLRLGLDDIELTLQHDAEIAAFEKTFRARRRWLFPTAAG